MHLLTGWLIGVFVCTPMREDEAFVLLMHVVSVPVVAAGVEHRLVQRSELLLSADRARR